jgi:lipopolysaccharide/colanic/teichoic acid biosynthesis glycosyltransferase
MPRVSRSRGFEWSERLLALVLLLIAAPLIALIALAIRLTAGGPAFHRGIRLGRDRRPFRMLKLRTLRVGAERITCGDLLSHRHNLTIPGGSFLRETRLDELPQLWNIVRGEMSFIGPRPERPEVLAAKCAGIPGYERRFSVRPGLIGISQLFTPHGTPKRYRTLLDNDVIRHESGAFRRLSIVAFTIWVVAGEILRRTRRQLVLVLRRLAGRFSERRRLRRVTPSGATVRLGRDGTSFTSRLVDMNEEALLVECPNEPGLEQATDLVLDIPLPGKNRPARRTARCSGKLAELRIRASSVHLVFEYAPATPRSEYMIHQYFLRDSLATPRRAWKGQPPPSRRAAASPPAHAQPARAARVVLRRVHHG